MDEQPFAIVEDRVLPPISEKHEETRLFVVKIKNRDISYQLVFTGYNEESARKESDDIANYINELIKARDYDITVKTLQEAADWFDTEPEEAVIPVGYNNENFGSKAADLLKLRAQMIKKE